MANPHEHSEPVSSSQADYEALRYVSPEQPCPYLPGRKARNEAYLAERLGGGLYERLLARGFRRSGRIVYRPQCRGCHECRQLRILTDRFKPSRSMRRTWNRNRDVVVEITDPQPTEEKHDLYRRYLDAQHDGSMSRSYESFAEFLYDAPIVGYEFQYILGDRLVAVSLTDRCENGLSSVYAFFDPEFARRSLGTYSVLREVDHCRREGLPFYYLGYFVADSRTMAYKARFRPNEILVSEGRWIALPE